MLAQINTSVGSVPILTAQQFFNQYLKKEIVNTNRVVIPKKIQPTVQKEFNWVDIWSSTVEQDVIDLNYSRNYLGHQNLLNTNILYKDVSLLFDFFNTELLIMILQKEISKKVNFINIADLVEVANELSLEDVSEAYCIKYELNKFQKYLCFISHETLKWFYTEIKMDHRMDRDGFDIHFSCKLYNANPKTFKIIKYDEYKLEDDIYQLRPSYQPNLHSVIINPNLF